MSESARRLVFVLVNLTFAADLLAAEGQKADVNFARDILPILSNKCFVCHGPDAKDDEMVRLDSFAGATEDRGGYQAINPDDPVESEILSRIHSDDNPMPPADAEKQLTDTERELLSRWVASGGEYAKHWAFVVPEKRIAQRALSATEVIDQLVGDQLKHNEIDFARRADRQTLARRASLTLIGLPPEPGRLTEYLNDDNDDAYERYVDELLDDPRFGEHQARYWLDAVRYGDTHGLHLDNRRGIYPYRDWVVWAFNSNLPLDEFITWQLAGDLLPDHSLDKLVATGFVRMNPTTAEGGVLPEEFQAKNNFDRVENLGTVLLGMTLTCARCHTHKYDPIPQTEYYRLMAFFNNTAEDSLDSNSYTYEPVAKVPKDQNAWTAWRELENKRDSLLAEADEIFATRVKDFSDAETKEWQQAEPNARMQLLAQEDRPYSRLVDHAKAIDLAKQIESAEENFTTTLVAKDLPEARETKLLKRGEYNQPVGDPLQPGILTVMGDFPDSAPRNRLGLAHWLTARDHPLVARVLVNRIWQRTFGSGLVRTPEDFGLQGQQPTHPELLDWLAVELQDSGWDLKHMLRSMVTSRTFCQSSAWRSDIDDPENRLWSRGPGYRLDAEVIRDVALWASQLLDPHMGGEGVKPYQPAGMWKAMAHPASNTKEYVRDEGRRLYRRSLYVYWKRTSPHPMMTLFDAPDRESSCVRRSRTNTALQSLGLLNETQRIEMARGLAQRFLKEESSDLDRFELAFTLLASKKPNEKELLACTQLLGQMRDRYRDSIDDAVALLEIGDARRDETLDPKEHAAWTQVAVTILASDLALLLY